MIDGLIHWSLRNRVLVLFIAALTLFWGGYETTRMPIDVFPDLTAPTVTVITEAHGMAPTEVERLITFPIESSMNGTAGVRRVRSLSTTGVSVVWVEFGWEMDIYRARQLAAEKLQIAQSSLPPRVEAPVITPITSIMGEIMFVALTSDQASAMDLKTQADWFIKRRLLAIPGVAQVIPMGGETKQYQVLVDAKALLHHGIGVNQVLDALAKTNENMSAGVVVEGDQEFLIHGLGRIRDVEDLGLTTVVSRGRQAILLQDLAEIAVGPAFKRGIGAFNGRHAVIIAIQKQPQANTLALTRRLDAELDALTEELPPDIQIERHIFRQADFIQVAIGNVVGALRDGALLVVIIVLLFLSSWRATGITILAIPLSLMAAILGLKWLGLDLNTMTLGGMAIAIGALVDDAIIDVENVVRRLRQTRGQGDTLATVFQASKEIRHAIVFATLMIVLVFVPLFFLSGIEGRLLRPLGYAFIISLGASLLVALTVTPVLCSMILPRVAAIKENREGKLATWLKHIYQPVLRFCLPRWRLIAAFAGTLLVLALWGALRLGNNFLPPFNEGTLTINAVTLPGTSLEMSDKLGAWVERILLEFPEVTATARRTGRAEQDEHVQGVHASEIDVSLQLSKVSKEAFLDDLRTALAAVPGMNISIGQPISHRIDHMLSGTRANIAVKVFGPDLARLRALAEQVREAMTAIPGVVDLALEQQPQIPQLSFQLNRKALARYALSVEDVMHAVESIYFGIPVHKVYEQQGTFDVWLKSPAVHGEDGASFGDLLIQTPSGALIPLRAMAEIRRDLGPYAISREDGSRKMVVMCNVSNRDLGGVMAAIQASLSERVSLPAGYRISFGGQFESAVSARRNLWISGSAVILGIVVLLFASLRSLRDAMLILVNLPLALIGGILGVYLHDATLSVASIIGFITLFGIATRNGLLMVTHIRRLTAEEGVKDPEEAVFRGALERLIPILMTAITAAFALIPLALKAGQPGGEIEAPMAMVILWGLTSSTLLNLLVLPALYFRFGSASS